MPKKSKTKYESIKLSLIYFLLGSLWILFSDRIANGLSDNQETLAIISTYKGWFYVIVTTIIIYFLIKRGFSNLELALTAEKELFKSNQELLETHKELETKNEEIKKQYDELKAYNEELRINRDRLNRAQEMLMSETGRFFWTARRCGVLMNHIVFTAIQMNHRLFLFIYRRILSMKKTVL